MRKNILSFLIKRKIDFWDLAATTGYIKNSTDALKEMQRDGSIEISKSKISLTAKGRKEVDKLKLSPKSLPLIGREDIKIAKKDLERFIGKRKRVFEKEDLDQLQITPKSLLRKVEIMKQKDDLLGKKVICVGDDDFFAIALALTRMCEEIAVIDIDKDILDHTKSVMKELGYKKFKAIHHSLLNPIPKDIKGYYDVFVTEPPDSLEGHTLFFSRGTELLKNNGVGYIGMSQNNFNNKRTAEVQKRILEMNTTITDIFNKFSLYETSGDELNWVKNLPEGIEKPKKSWFNSHLMRTELIGKAKPMIKGKMNKSFGDKMVDNHIYC